MAMDKEQKAAAQEIQRRLAGIMVGGGGRNYLSIYSEGRKYGVRVKYWGVAPYKTNTTPRELLMAVRKELASVSNVEVEFINGWSGGWPSISIQVHFQDRKIPKTIKTKCFDILEKLRGEIIPTAVVYKAFSTAGGSTASLPHHLYGAPYNRPYLLHPSQSDGRYLTKMDYNAWELCGG